MTLDQPSNRLLTVSAVGFAVLLFSTYVLSFVYLSGNLRVRGLRRGETADGSDVGNSDADDLSWLRESLNEENRSANNTAMDLPKKTPKIQLSWLNRAANVRVRRGSSRYRNPNRTRAMDLKKPSIEGKSNFDDSYFVGPGTSCLLPEGLQTVDVRCKIWPTYTRCNSYCVYGSTFDEGIQREHSCKFKENKWSKDFDECKPFVNCKVQLKSPGNVKCFDNELSNKPYCEIFCAIDEDNDEVKTQSYKCNANATWSPPLPFCAEPREHVTLAKTPKVIEHTGFKYPEAFKP